MTLPSQRNRALRGMGDTSDSTTTLQFYGQPSPVAAPVYSDPGFDVCDTATGNCAGAQTVLTPAQLAAMSAANTAYNLTGALTPTPTSSLLSNINTAANANPNTTFIVIGVVIAAVMYLTGPSGRRR